jgi:hypothetical protein
MTFLSRDRAEQMFADRRERLALAIRQGDREVDRVLGPHRHRCASRTVSNLRNDLICEEARKSFADDPDIRFQRKHGRWMMYVRDEAIVLFKKLDWRNRHQSIPTQLAMQLFGQLAMAAMPDAAPRLIAGFKTDRFNLAVQSVALTYPDEHGPRWMLPLEDDNPPAATIQPATPPPSDKPKPRIRVRDDDAMKKRGSDASAG